MKISQLFENTLKFGTNASITAEGIPPGAKQGTWSFGDGSGWSYTVTDTFLNASKTAIAAYKRDKGTSFAHLSLQKDSPKVEREPSEAEERSMKLKAIMADMQKSAERSHQAKLKSLKQQAINKPIIAQKNKEWEEELARRIKANPMTPEQIQKLKDDANAEWEYNNKRGWSNE